MNEMQVFSNPEFGQLRTLVIDEMPWTVGKDVAVALGYKNGSRDINRHVDAEDRMQYRNGTSSIRDSLGRAQYPILINESGLYSLILSSKLPSAKRFKHWVTSEVLPAIRRTGSYGAPEAEQEPQRVFTPDDFIKAASIIAGCRNERLPYVMSLLRQGGFTVPRVEELNEAARRDDNGECAKWIDKAVCSGLTVRGIGRLTGLHATQIS